MPREENSADPLTIGDLTRKIELTDVDGIGDDLYVDTLALSTVAKAAPLLTVDDVWPLLQPLRVEHLRLVGSDAALRIEDPAASKTIRDVVAASPALPAAQPLQGLLWGDIIGSAADTEPLPSAKNVTIASILGNFRGVTLGEFLRAAQPIADQDTSVLDLGAVDLADYSTATGVDFSIGFRVDGTARPDGVRLVATLPAGSRYVPGSAVLTGGATPTGADAPDVEPTLFGDTLIWLITNVQPGVDYSLSFSVRSPAETGIVTASASGQLQRRNVFASSTTSIDFREAFEPNDLPTDTGVQTIGPDEIFLSQISTATDVDLYRFEVTEPGTRIGATLSNLPADFDLTIIGPTSTTVAASGSRTVESVGDGQLGVAGGTTSSTLADAGQYQPPAGFGVIARSTGRGTSTEQIDQIPLFELGTYYVVVTGYNGATSGRSYALQLATDTPTLPAPECPPNGVTFPFDDGVDATAATIPAGTNTLFVINNRRFGDQYGADAADDVLAAIDDLASEFAPAARIARRTRPGRRRPRPRLDCRGPRSPTPPGTPNPASSTGPTTSSTPPRRRSPPSYRAHPGIDNVVMVGSDKIIPFARLSDRTLLGNEQNYALTFAEDRSTALYAALQRGHLLLGRPLRRHESDARERPVPVRARTGDRPPRRGPGLDHRATRVVRHPRRQDPHRYRAGHRLRLRG